jgi:hypothetical protein
MAQKTRNRRSLAWTTAGDRRFCQVRFLLEMRAEVSSKGGYYGTPLQATARWGKIEVVKVLLHKGAEVDANGGHFESILQAAAHIWKRGYRQNSVEGGADTIANGRRLWCSPTSAGEQ